MLRRLSIVLVVIASAAVFALPGEPASAASTSPTTIQAVYAVPSDVAPVSGRLEASSTSIAVVQDWFAGQTTNGDHPVFNETGGVVDVELLVLPKTRSQIEAMSMYALDTLLLEEAGSSFDSVADSELFVYLEAPLIDGGACGYAGRIVVIVMQNCNTYPSSTARFPYGDTYLVAHELTHLLGAVASCAPNHIPGGHLDGDNRDVLFMGAGGRDWANIMLDPGHDDYYNHGRSDCPDIADSPLMGTWESNGDGTPPPSTPVFCDGLEATIVGTSGNDTLTGTTGADVIAGLQGDDVIHGLGGDDVICAGKGDDIVYGGYGFDILFGAQGNDALFAANGSTSGTRADTRGARMFGGAGNDTLHGTSRWDRMQGGLGVDALHGYEGRDWMRGGGHADRLVGGGNIDDMHGGNGNDHLTISGSDTVRGGAGAKDRCVITSGSTPTMLRSCELLG